MGGRGVRYGNRENRYGNRGDRYGERVDNNMGNISGRTVKEEGCHTSWDNSGSSSSWKPNWSKRDDKPSFKAKAEPSKDHKAEGKLNQGKSYSQPSRNCDIKFLSVWEQVILHHNVQHKRVRVLKDGGSESEGKFVNESMPPLEDVSDNEYPVDGEL
ncbi:hypothetical protein LWI28_001737 [Acer negundo]|uniref:Uncharacterized protein n=1 Tax=Acer negundo TaxID=4023 RepID=A0AAD5JS72_ACENE|nr:hypothetical protein LWI28_001737 [Acer negundo]